MKASEFDTKCDPGGPVGRRRRVEGAYAVLLLDRAGWRTTAKLDAPSDVTPDLPAFPRARTEPGRERLAYLRANGLSNRVFETLRRDHRSRLRGVAKTRR